MQCKKPRKKGIKTKEKAGERMPYISPEIIVEAKKIDLLTYLKNYYPDELVKCSRDTYCTKEHDSLKISNGKWMWFSQGIGGKNAIDYLIKVQGMSFIEAVEDVTRKCAIAPPVKSLKPSKQDRPLLLPQKSNTSNVVISYLSQRGIDYEIVDHCLKNNLIMESFPYHNVVFIGYDNQQKARYASYRATNDSRIMGDCSGSKKDFSFRLLGSNKFEIHLFESAIDLLSYATLCKLKGGDWKELTLISLAGVYSPARDIGNSKVPAALKNYLEDNPQTKRIVLHLDNDIPGRMASKALQLILPNNLEVIDDPPSYGKDINDFLCFKLNIKRNKERKYER